MKKHSKMYVEALSNIDKNKSYEVTDAIKLLKSLKSKKFDETVDVVFKINMDAKKTDQNIRGSLVLPKGTGKTKRVLVVTKTKASDAGEADFCGAEDMIEKIEKENWFDFDTLIATPDAMPLLGKLGRILGPKGLMPNPKTGTVTTDVVKAINDVKSGRVEYRTDSFGNIHGIIGKASFEDNKLVENLATFVNTILKLKPATVKGDYVKNISISSTQGPGIKISVDTFDK